MPELDLREVGQFVNVTIEMFHNRRLEILSKLTLKQLISKNPYLFRAKNITRAADLIAGTMDAFLSSSEEKQFGDFLENLAIFVAGKTINGHKSSTTGIDLELARGSDYYIVSIKSSTNWGNSSQHKKLAQDFRDATRRLKQSLHISNVHPVLGICYGRAKSTFTDDGYWKIVGQNFWALISGNNNLYIDIIEPVGFRAKEHNDAYQTEKDRIANRLTMQFITTFCDPTGEIDWHKVVQANSGNFDLDTIKLKLG